MGYRPHHPPAPLLFGYDPFRDLPLDHLARLVEHVVEETVLRPARQSRRGQPPYDPRVGIKVLVYSYCTGVRSSRVMERNCKESLPYLYLTRGEAPSYRTLCTTRTEQGPLVEAVWEGLFTIAAAVGIERLGRITLDSTKLRANASPEAVLKQEEYAAVRAELERIQAEVARLDAQEAAEDSVGRTELGRTVPHEEMRDLLRRVRRQRREERRSTAATPPGDGGLPPAGPSSEPASGSSEPDAAPCLPLEDVPSVAPTAAAPVAQKPMSPQMLRNIATTLQALAAAEAEQRKHLCVTDPDARMMYGERHRGIRESHSFEVAVDNGLLVAAQASQETHDNPRLTPLVAAAEQHEPEGVQAVDADSGYYTGEGVAALLRQGIDTCIPDSGTARDLHQGQRIGTTRNRTQGQVPFTYDAATDTHTCPEGNVLVRLQRRRQGGSSYTVYRSERPCVACPLRAACLTQPQARHRILKVPDEHELLAQARERFNEPAQQKRYRHRGEQVETIFGFLRGTLGYHRWWLRGAEKVACEAKLFQAAYQFRKVHRAWAR